MSIAHTAHSKTRGALARLKLESWAGKRLYLNGYQLWLYEYPCPIMFHSHNRANAASLLYPVPHRHVTLWGQEDAYLRHASAADFLLKRGLPPSLSLPTQPSTRY